MRRPVFPLSSAKGGEGRGEEADSSSNPLAPILSPLGRGEGVGQYQDAPIFCRQALLVLEGRRALVCGSDRMTLRARHNYAPVRNPQSAI
jgi:hypothetical protein